MACVGQTLVWCLRTVGRLGRETFSAHCWGWLTFNQSVYGCTVFLLEWWLLIVWNGPTCLFSPSFSVSLSACLSVCLYVMQWCNVCSLSLSLPVRLSVYLSCNGVMSILSFSLSLSVSPYICGPLMKMNDFGKSNAVLGLIFRRKQKQKNNCTTSTDSSAEEFYLPGSFDFISPCPPLAVNWDFEHCFLQSA